jgi:beta-galactosidase
MENAIVNQVLPGLLTELVGSEVEEYDMFGGVPNGHVYVTDRSGTDYEAFGIADLLEPASAESVLTYKGRYYSGRPAATRNKVGSGVCYYLGTAPGPDGVRAFLAPIAEEAGLTLIGQGPERVEIAKRRKDGTVYRFYLNHADEPETVRAVASGKVVADGSGVDAGAAIELPPFGVTVIAEG